MGQNTLHGMLARGKWIQQSVAVLLAGGASLDGFRRWIFTLMLLGVVSANAADPVGPRDAAPALQLSFEGSDAAKIVVQGNSELARGIRERGRRVTGKRQPFAVELPDGVWSAVQGSVVVWWRPEWTVEDTHSRSGQSGSTLRGLFPGFAIDRPFHTGHWHQLVTTWDRKNVVRHYVDGELVARRSRRLEALPEKPWMWCGGEGVWQIGANGSRVAKVSPWDVTVDEVRLYQRPLSIDEIQADFLAGVIAAGQMEPNSAIANRVTDLRLGEKQLIGSRHKPMFGFPSIGKDGRGRLYLKAKLGGEYNQGNRWNRSTDGGRTWTPIEESSVTRTLRGVDSKVGTRIAPDFGYKEIKDGRVDGVLRITAVDGSDLPTKPISMAAPFPTGKLMDATWLVSPTVLRSLDGGLLVLMVHSTEKDHSSTLWIMKSSDEGLTWKPLSEVVKRSPLFREGVNESTLLRGADGSLVCLARTGWAMIEARSNDDGVTWNPWKFLGVDGVKPDAIRLASGLSLCAYGRPDVNLLVSLDENFEHWDAPFQILNANRTPHDFVPDWHQHGTFYADPVEVEPGRVLVVYDTAGDSGQPGQLSQCRLWLQEVFVDSIAEFDKVRQQRLTPDSDRLKMSEHWQSSIAWLSRAKRLDGSVQESQPTVSTPFIATRESGAEVRFTFEGTGLVGQLTLAPDGGDLEVWIDGRRRRIVKTAASHTHWLTRRVLARDLKPGRHEARLVAQCPELARPFLPSAQELMRTSAIETIRDSRGKTRIVLHAVEVIEETGRNAKHAHVASERGGAGLQPANDTGRSAGSEPAPRGENITIAGLELDRKDVVIHASFNGRATPEIAPESQLNHLFKRPSDSDDERDKPVFTTGIRGQSLKLRDEAETLQWSLPDTPVPAEGTLCFWFRPQWPAVEVGRTQARTLLNFSRLGSIRKWGRLHISAFQASAFHIRGRHANPSGRFWNSETWHHLVVSWSADNTQKLYFDGELVAIAEGKRRSSVDPPVLPAIGLSLTGQADMDLDELTLVSRPLSQSEIEASYVSGLHAQKRLISPTPAIRVEISEPIEAVGQQAHGFNDLIRFPELFRQNDGSLLLRSDNRAISLHFFDARDAVTPAGKLRWFRSGAKRDGWKEIASGEQVARNLYHDKDDEVILIAETAKHQGNGVFETTLRRVSRSRETSGDIAPQSISPDDVKPATFNVGIEPAATADHWLYLNRSSVIANNGNMLISGFVRPKDEWKSRLVILESKDHGLSWKRVSEVWRDDRYPDRLSGGISAPPMFGPTQANLLRTSPNRILCVFRTDAALLACASTDDGRTWSEPWMIGPDGVNPTLVQSGQLIALSYGRPDVNVAFSADQGKTWFGFTDLLPADRWPVEANGLVGPLGYNFKPSTGHVALLADGPNRFLMAYDTNWVSDPSHDLPRASVWVTPVSFAQTVVPQTSRFIAATSQANVHRSGAWEGGSSETPYLASGDRKGTLRFEFDGTGVALVHPTIFGGGQFRIAIDGKQRGTVDLRTPQSWWGRRTLLASNLPRGRHVVELVVEVKPDFRAPVMPDRWPSYEPFYPTLFEAAGRTRAALHGFEVW